MKKVMTILTVLAVLTISSCSKKQEELYFSPPESVMKEQSLQEDEQKNNEVETVERKIIKQGSIKFETADIKKTKSLIVQTVQDLNGYISKDNVYDYSDRYEHRLTIRIPAEKFDLLLKTISESVDKLDSKNIDVLDVTEEYIDIEARVKTKKELQAKYIELLKKATKVEEILSIEKEIGNIQTEIESVEGRMKYLADRIAFSTLTVTYYQKTTFEFGFSSKFADGLINGWNVFLWFIVGLSHLWVFIIIVILMIFIIKYWKKKKKNVS